jgi:hypothetical protein
MRLWVYILTIIALLTSAYSQNYKQVKIYLSGRADVKILYEAGLEIDHGEFTKDNALIVFLSDREFIKLKETDFKYEILIDNWFEHYKSRPVLSKTQEQAFIDESVRTNNVSGFGFGSMGGFYTLDEVIAKLDEMRMLYPNLISAKDSIGSSVEGRTIYAVKISDNPDESENEPGVLYTALHHAREPMSMMQMIYFMYYLLENYNADPSVQYLVNNRELFFIPVVNPDGYEYNRQTNPNGGGFWRKNRKHNGGTFYGVDLNRNYGPYSYWNAPNGGSSSNSYDEIYRGIEPFSEPETQTIRDFLAVKNIKSALNYHSFGSYLIYPYGCFERETPDSLAFREFSEDMTIYNGYTTGTDLQTVGYSVRGYSDDYFYDGDTLLNGGKIFAMSPEVGRYYDGFWPSQARIFPLAEENLFPNLYYAWAAGDYITFENPIDIRRDFTAGNTITIPLTFKNKGLSTGYNITAELTSLIGNAIVVNDIVSFDSIEARTTRESEAQLAFTISPEAFVNDQLELKLTISSGGAVISEDTLKFTVEAPTNLPVELTEFNAKSFKDYVLLNWTTKSELNNRGFEIYRKGEGTDWYRIGFVAGEGTAMESHSYSYSDKNIIRGTYSYRLKQLDYNGTYRTYGSLKVEYIGITDYTLEQNYPNPFNPETVIRYSTPEDGRVKITVYNLLGVELKTLVDEYKSAGNYEVIFNTKDLKEQIGSGIYFYKMEASNYSKTRKMIILR